MVQPPFSKSAPPALQVRPEQDRGAQVYSATAWLLVGLTPNGPLWGPGHAILTSCFTHWPLSSISSELYSWPWVDSELSIRYWFLYETALRDLFPSTRKWRPIGHRILASWEHVLLLHVGREGRPLAFDDMLFKLRANICRARAFH